MKTILIVLVTVCVTITVTAQTQRPITFDDLIGMGRVGDPQISRDGKTVAFVVTYHNKTENRTNSNIYLVPTNGGEVRQLTSAKGANNSPRWMPDGTSIAFISTREGGAQIWVVPIAGGEARKISSISTGASGLVVSPDGKWFAFSSDVYPDCPTDDCNKQREEAAEQSKVKAKIFERLPYRVWNSWKDGKRSHLFILPTSGGTTKDVTPGDFDTPPIDLGGNWDFAFSPDSKEIAFTRNPDTMVAISTNNELYVVPLEGGEPKNISDNPANDTQPLYSPDGKYIAYRAMKRPGFEADRNYLVLYERSTGKRITLTEGSDYSVNEVLWTPDSKALIFNAADKGWESAIKVTVNTKKIEPILNEGYDHSLRLSSDGKILVFIRETTNKPAEV
ncbi:MAG TPA: DPP IV N-terminal domain-containing protein, partial [Bacteroidota bacterium]